MTASHLQYMERIWKPVIETQLILQVSEDVLDQEILKKCCFLSSSFSPNYLWKYNSADIDYSMDGIINSWRLKIEDNLHPA